MSNIKDWWVTSQMNVAMFCMTPSLLYYTMFSGRANAVGYKKKGNESEADARGSYVWSAKTYCKLRNPGKKPALSMVLQVPPMFFLIIITLHPLLVGGLYPRDIVWACFVRVANGVFYLASFLFTRWICTFGFACLFFSLSLNTASSIFCFGSWRWIVSLPSQSAYSIWIWLMWDGCELIFRRTKNISVEPSSGFMVARIEREKKLDSIVGRRPSAPKAPQGIYLYGNVGCGECSFILDDVTSSWLRPVLITQE